MQYCGENFTTNISSQAVSSVILNLEKEGEYSPLDDEPSLLTSASSTI
jgi:hypothetical protein